MKLEGIINIAGKTGLYKIISKAKNNMIVESLIDKKRIPLYSHEKANMLEEIGIYTYEDTKSLSEIFDEIAKKENYNLSISHKSSKEELTNYFKKIVTNYDEEKVYLSDIKKVIHWYNIMCNAGLIQAIDKKEKTIKKPTKKNKKSSKPKK